MKPNTTRRHDQRALTRALAALCAALVMLLFGLAPAFAHASLISTVPADGAVIVAAPSVFTLRFSEPVSPLALKLIHADGSSTTLDRFALRDAALEIAAPVGLSKGTHVLAWRAVSEDGHPVGGSVVFSIGAPSLSPPALAEATDWPVRAAIWTSKLALYLGLLLGAGGAFTIIWLARGERDGIRAVRLFALLGLVAAPLSVGAHGLDALGAPLDTILSAAIWKAGFATSYGRTGLLAMLACGVALAALASHGLKARALALFGLVGTGAALAASGHASAAEPQWLTRPAVLIHGIAAAYWAGALIPLGLTLKRRTTGAADVLRRFSLTIPYIVALLAAAGIVLTVIQVRTPSALMETAYGRVLLVKLALVAGLLVLAVVNRWTLTAPAQQGDVSATRRLVRSIATETALVIVIVGVVALWRFTPPPRALAIAAAQPAVMHIHAAKAMADVSIKPGRAGPVVATVIVMTGDFAPLDAKEVTLVLSNPARGIEPIKRRATKPGDGTWRVDGLIVPVPGKWTVRIDILVTDFDLVRLDGELEIRP